jgi:hypothetical protein
MHRLTLWLVLTGLILASSSVRLPNPVALNIETMRQTIDVTPADSPALDLLRSPSPALPDASGTSSTTEPSTSDTPSTPFPVRSQPPRNIRFLTVPKDVLYCGAFVPLAFSVSPLPMVKRRVVNVEVTPFFANGTQARPFSFYRRDLPMDLPEIPSWSIDTMPRVESADIDFGGTRASFMGPLIMPDAVVERNSRLTYIDASAMMLLPVQYERRISEFTHHVFSVEIIDVNYVGHRSSFRAKTRPLQIGTLRICLWLTTHVRMCI